MVDDNKSDLDFQEVVSLEQYKDSVLKGKEIDELVQSVSFRSLLIVANVLFESGDYKLAEFYFDKLLIDFDIKEFQYYSGLCKLRMGDELFFEGFLDLLEGLFYLRKHGSEYIEERGNDSLVEVLDMAKKHNLFLYDANDTDLKSNLLLLSKYSDYKDLIQSLLFQIFE